MILLKTILTIGVTCFQEKKKPNSESAKVFIVETYRDSQYAHNDACPSRIPRVWN
jgi:hypothetical protein